MKTKVICDTMIWYDIINGIVIPEERKDAFLIGTGLNIIELMTTENYIYNFNLVRDTLGALQEHHDEIIDDDPIDYILIYETNIEYESKSRNEIRQNLAAFNLIVDGEINVNDFDDEKKNKLNKLIDEFNTPVNELVESMNNCLEETKANGIAKYGSKNNFKRELRNNLNTKYEVQEMIHKLLNIRYGSNIDKSLINWNNLELLIEIWDTCLKEKILQTNSNFKPNDYFDIMNMAYVSEIDLYWTRETSWLNLMKKKTETLKYLYNCEN